MASEKVIRAAVTPSPEVSRALSTLEREAGGRSEILISLQHAASLTRDEEILMNLLADPRHHHTPIATLCGMASVSIPKFIQLLGKSKGARALIAAMDQLYRKAPEAASDLAERSAPYYIRCETCRGATQVRAPDASADEDAPPKLVICPTCAGEGKHLRLPDLDRQKLYFELIGLLKKGGGVQVGVQVNTVNGSAVSTSADFRAATDRLLWPSAERQEASWEGSASEGSASKEEAVEAEVVEPDQPTPIEDTESG